MSVFMGLFLFFALLLIAELGNIGKIFLFIIGMIYGIFCLKKNSIPLLISSIILIIPLGVLIFISEIMSGFNGDRTPTFFLIFSVRCYLCYAITSIITLLYKVILYFIKRDKDTFISSCIVFMISFLILSLCEIPK